MDGPEILLRLAWQPKLATSLTSFTFFN